MFKMHGVARAPLSGGILLVVVVSSALLAASVAFADDDPGNGSQPSRAPCSCEGGSIVTLGTGIYQRVPVALGVNGTEYELCALDREGVFIALDGARYPLWRNAPVRVQGQSIVLVNQSMAFAKVCLREVGSGAVHDGF